MRRKAPLRRKTPLRRAPFRGKASGKSSYRTRIRGFAYMGWVLTRPCVFAGDGCNGRVQADHAGSRAYNRKAADTTCIPLCMQHHHDRTAYVGVFKDFTAPVMRGWCDQQIATVQAAYATHILRLARQA